MNPCDLPQAACEGMHPNEFFRPELAEQAKLLCSDCPVRERCLDYAVTNHVAFGVWGGKTPGERRRMSRQRRGPRAPMPTKICSGCRVERPVDQQLTRNASRIDGLSAQCKSCENVRTAERHQRRKMSAAS